MSKCATFYFDIRTEGLIYFGPLLSHTGHTGHFFSSLLFPFVSTSPFTFILIRPSSLLFPLPPFALFNLTSIACSHCHPLNHLTTKSNTKRTLDAIAFNWRQRKNIESERKEFEEKEDAEMGVSERESWTK